jgi:hypothetical protein
MPDNGMAEAFVKTFKRDIFTGEPVLMRDCARPAPPLAQHHNPASLHPSLYAIEEKKILLIS